MTLDEDEEEMEVGMSDDEDEGRRKGKKKDTTDPDFDFTLREARQHLDKASKEHDEATVRSTRRALGANQA